MMTTCPVSMINRWNGKEEKKSQEVLCVGRSTKNKVVGDLRSPSDNVAQSSDSPAAKITNDDGDDTIDETPLRMWFFCIVLVFERFFIFLFSWTQKTPNRLEIKKKLATIIVRFTHLVQQYYSRLIGTARVKSKNMW